MAPESNEQRLEERLARLVSEMDELIAASRNSPFAQQALEIAREELVKLESRPCN
jgi:hypothetical protein